VPPFITDLWNLLLVHPLISLLVLAYDFIPDFGVAVILVTIAIRLALLPVFRAQLRSSRAMQELAPALNELKKKYGNDRARLQQEQMKLYQERGMNPLAGCLPMLIFFPVLFAMYAAFQQVGGLVGAEPLVGENLRRVLFPFVPPPPGCQLDELGHWLAECRIDLTAHWLPWIQNLAHPDHLIPLPFGAIGLTGIGPLPILSALLQLAASIMALPRNPPQTDDPTQRTMQSMTYYLPIITVLFFSNLSAGVFLYYITATIFQMVQQYFVAGWGQLPRWLPFLNKIASPADRGIRREQREAIAEAEADMAAVPQQGAAVGGRRRGRRRKR
jgi:YidC/Oxa1 family membrane protein insertase